MRARVVTLPNTYKVDGFDATRPVRTPVHAGRLFLPPKRARIVNIAVALRGHSEWQPGGIVLPR